MSADTIVPGAGNPQAFNRYAYVRNNPLKYVDPSGHFGILATAAIGGILGGIVLGGTYAAISLYNGNFNGEDLLLVTAAGAASGALVGTGVGAAQGIAGLSVATSMAVGSVAVSTGVGAASAGEGYLLSLPVSKAVGASDGNFDRADFNSNFVAGGASGFAKGLTGVGPVGAQSLTQ